MSPFQIGAISLLSVVIVRELIQLSRSANSQGILLTRIIVWITALTAVARPMLLQSLANVLGIGRGTDVLLYLLVFAFLGTTFFLYARTVVLQRQLTELVRVYALATATRREPKGRP